MKWIEGAHALHVRMMLQALERDWNSQGRIHVNPGEAQLSITCRT